MRGESSRGASQSLTDCNNGWRTTVVVVRTAEIALGEPFSESRGRCAIHVTRRIAWAERHARQTGEVNVPDEKSEESVSAATCDYGSASAELARRRKSNREHMRRRRADPAHRARELEKRKSRPTAPSCGGASVSSNAVQPLGRVCSMCHVRAAVEEITRLEPSNFTRGGFVQVRLAYCGRC
jgi:hypothetical protein